jgi:5'-nucleotidase
MRGIALSTPVTGEDPDVSHLAPHVERVLQLLIPDDSLRLVNVNFPPNPTGIRWTRQAVEQYDGKVVPGTDPMGRQHFWFTVFPLEHHAEGTDLWAIENGFVSVTPLRLDLTDHKALAAATARVPDPTRDELPPVGSAPGAA